MRRDATLAARRPPVLQVVRRKWDGRDAVAHSYLTNRARGADMKRASWDALRRLGRPVLVSMVMLFLGSTRAAADISPAGCNGNGVQLSISRNPANGVNGQAITYKFSIANLDDTASGTVACDATGG